MNHKQFKAARVRLDLTCDELAALLDTDPQTIRRTESNPANSTARKPAPRMIRLINAYLEGHRPGDWPAKADRPRRGRPRAA